MNFVAFKYFNEVAKTKSIRRAADRLHIAPSAVSRQLVQLEHSMGATLLERTNVGIELTPAGQLVESYTLGVFSELERLRGMIRDYKGLQEGEVKLCVIEGLIAGFLPKVIADFNAKYPAINFTVMQDSTDRIIEALIRNEADIGCVYNSRPRPEIQVVAEHVEPVMCLVAPCHPFAERASLSLAELCETPIALPVSSFGLRQIFERAVAQRRLEPRIALTANTLELTRKMAQSGRMVTIGPTMCAMREIEQGLFKAIPIEEPEFAEAKSLICVHRSRAVVVRRQGIPQEHLPGIRTGRNAGLLLPLRSAGPASSLAHAPLARAPVWPEALQFGQRGHRPISFIRRAVPLLASGQECRSPMRQGTRNDTVREED